VKNEVMWKNKGETEEVLLLVLLERSCNPPGP
jgi:hypothetical protein